MYIIMECARREFSFWLSNGLHNLVKKICRIILNLINHFPNLCSLYYKQIAHYLDRYQKFYHDRLVDQSSLTWPEHTQVRAICRPIGKQCYLFSKVASFLNQQPYLLLGRKNTSNLEFYKRNAQKMNRQLIKCKRYNNWTILIMYQKPSPAGLVLEFQMWRHFDTKQKLKSFTLCHCI